MTHITLDIDDEACAEVMRQYGIATKSEAINFALRRIAIRPATLEEACAMEGSGWDGDLDEMRANRFPD
ncbi:MAG: type II toxin-antitoxin system VapB family antitoxin [Chloroflexi bacterium]|nr:type II toxin-antitoxin system VapB family antitoxin [Chloroflexota bacterium]